MKARFMEQEMKMQSPGRQSGNPSTWRNIKSSCYYNCKRIIRVLKS